MHLKSARILSFVSALVLLISCVCSTTALAAETEENTDAVNNQEYPSDFVESDEQLSGFDGFAFSASTGSDSVTDVLLSSDSDVSFFATEESFSNFTLISKSSFYVGVGLNSSQPSLFKRYDFVSGSSFSVPLARILASSSTSYNSSATTMHQSFFSTSNVSSASFFLKFGSVVPGTYIDKVQLTGSLTFWLGDWSGTASGSIPSWPVTSASHYSTLTSCDLGYYDSSGVFHSIASVSPSSRSVSFDSSVSYSVQSNVNELGLLFRLSNIPSASLLTYIYQGYTGISRYGINFTSGSFSGTSVDDRSELLIYIEPLLQSILSKVSEIYTYLSTAIIDALNSIAGSQFTPPPAQSAAAEQYKDDMQITLDEIDSANQIIEDNTNRPAADSIVPSIPPIIQNGTIGGGDASATAMMGNFGTLLGSDLILYMLLSVVSLAFVSYVLFGKKG